MAENGVLLKATGLWERTSAKGHTYYVGRWGGVKVLILPNRDRENDDAPPHLLFITEAADRPRKAAATRPSHRKLPERSIADGPDDDITDLWR